MKEPYQKPISFVKSSYIYLLQSLLSHIVRNHGKTEMGKGMWKM